jgi:plasmid replication initiation protein
VKRSCNLPNPLHPECSESFEIIQLFSSIKYSASTGIIDVSFNDEALPYLLYLNKYTILMLNNFFGLKNKYSLHMYMYCKILQNKYTKEGSIKSSVNLFKEDLKIEKKYRSFTTLKTYVLDVISEEINSLTDLKFSYELIKSGRSYSDIIFRFSQKNYIDGEIAHNESHIKQNNSPEVSVLQLEDKKGVILQLRSHGIKEKKASDLITRYGLTAAEESLSALLAEIDKGKNIKNVSGYLIRIIENSVNSISSADIKNNQIAVKKAREEENIKTEANWESIENYCSKNQSGIEKLYNFKENTKLVEQEHIDVFESLKILIEMNPELIGYPRPIIGIYINISAVTLGVLHDIVCKLEIADNF